MIAVNSADPQTVKAVVEDQQPPLLNVDTVRDKPVVSYNAGEWYYTCHLHRPIFQIADPNRFEIERRMKAHMDSHEEIPVV